ncbi:MAG TPA: hypothetical protein P5049_03100 [Methanothrix sp.]|nr:hypothetical protein [Methanothrix sp.]
MIEDSSRSLNTYLDTWKDFGRNLEAYIASHGTELENESYDLILTFSRGGAILAFAFACLLKDNSKSSEYSKPYKASVRSIPRGITVKIDDPCFVMDHPASRLEKEDILNNLEDELRSFSEEYNEGKPLKVLIMDDNLTGATRVKFLENELDKLENKGLVIGYRTLAYVRHKAFLENEIPTIISFPKDKDNFVMPWHVPHPPRELNLKDSHTELERLIFRFKLNCDYEMFIEKVKEKYGFDEGFIFNGASNFYIIHHIPQETSERVIDFVELSHFPNKLYPPKMCLNSNGSDEHNSSNFLKLCSYLNDMTIDVCTTCSCLNCNKYLIKNVQDAANGGDISIEAIFRNKVNLELKRAIDKWFAEFSDVMVTRL